MRGKAVAAIRGQCAMGSGAARSWSAGYRLLGAGGGEGTPGSRR